MEKIILSPSRKIINSRSKLVRPGIRSASPAITPQIQSKSTFAKIANQAEESITVSHQRKNIQYYHNSAGAHERTFILTEQVAKGSYGIIYKAQSCYIDRNSGDLVFLHNNNNKNSKIIVAVKIFRYEPEAPPKDENDQNSSENIIASPSPLIEDRKLVELDGSSIIEFDILARMEHPYLMSLETIKLVEPCYESPWKDHVFAVSMPWAEHGNIYRLMRNLEKYKKQISFKNKIHMLWQILQGVNHLHKHHILHMDIKLENILVMKYSDDGVPLIKVADFGMSVYANSALVRYFDREAVTITYRCPELFAEPKRYTDRVDVWAIGMLFLFLMLETSHIFKRFDKRGYVEKFLAENFNEKYRRGNIIRYLTNPYIDYTDINMDIKKIPCGSYNEIHSEMTRVEFDHVVSFINSCLTYNPEQRPNIKELLKHPLFSATIKSRDIPNPSLPVKGKTIFPPAWILKHNQITVESYEGLNYIIRLAELINCRAEVFFIAADLYVRSLRKLYLCFNHISTEYSDIKAENRKIREENIRIRAQNKEIRNKNKINRTRLREKEELQEKSPLWKNTRSCELSDVLSCGGGICLWMAWKAMETNAPDLYDFLDLTKNIYNDESIIWMEHQIITGLDGLLYRWNPFLDCDTEADVRKQIDRVTNIFEYITYNVNVTKYGGDNKKYRLNFKNVYRTTNYYKTMTKYNKYGSIDLEAFVKEIYDKDSKVKL